LSLVVQVAVSVRQTIAKALGQHEEVAVSLITAKVAEAFDKAILRTLAPDSKLGPEVLMRHLEVCHKYLAEMEAVPLGLQVIARSLAEHGQNKMLENLKLIQDGGIMTTSALRLSMTKDLVSRSHEYTAIDGFYGSIPDGWEASWKKYFEAIANDSGIRKTYIVFATGDELKANRSRLDNNVAYLTQNGWTCYICNPSDIANSHGDQFVNRLREIGNYYEVFGDTLKGVEVKNRDGVAATNWRENPLHRTIIRSLRKSTVDSDILNSVIDHMHPYSRDQSRISASPVT